MLKPFLFAATAIAMIAGPAAARERLSGEAELAKLLEGRVAGEPKSCLNRIASRNMKIIDGTAIVFRDGRTLWVNVPRNAKDLDDSDILITRQFGSGLCRLDNVTMADPIMYMYSGNIFLGDFVPYRLADAG